MSSGNGSGSGSGSGSDKRQLQWLSGSVLR